MVIPWTARAALVAVAVCGGCGHRSTGQAACPPLEVTIDGTPVPAPTFGLAYGRRGEGLVVQVFNHDGVTCDELQAQRRGGFRDPPAGETMVGAWADGAAPAPTGVVFSSNTDLRVTRTAAGARLVTVVSSPTGPGAPVALCIPDVVHIPLGGGDVGELPARPAAEVRGLLVGRYCPPPR